MSNTEELKHQVEGHYGDGSEPKKKLFVAFHLDGQDSQPLIGVGSTHDEAMRLIRIYDVDEDHIDAGYLNSIWDDPTEIEEKKYRLQQSSYSRAYFIEEVFLDGERVPTIHKYFKVDGRPTLTGDESAPVETSNTPKTS